MYLPICIKAYKCISLYHLLLCMECYTITHFCVQVLLSHVLLSQCLLPSGYVFIMIVCFVALVLCYFCDLISMLLWTACCYCVITIQVVFVSSWLVDYTRVKVPTTVTLNLCS